MDIFISFIWIRVFKTHAREKAQKLQNRKNTTSSSPYYIIKCKEVSIGAIKKLAIK